MPAAPPRHRAASAQQPSHFGHRRRHGEDHHRLQHVDHLLGHERVHRQPALRERREEQRGQPDAYGMAAPDQRHGDAEEAGAGREPFLVVVLVAEHVVQPAEPGDARRDIASARHVTPPTSTPPYSAASRLQPHRAQLEAARVRNRNHQSATAVATIASRIVDVGRGAMEHGDDSRPAAAARRCVDLRRVQRVGHVELCAATM